MAGPAAMASQAQGVPVRLFESEHRLMLVAPMPGLEPADIRVTVDGDVVVIHGELRGPRQNDVKLVESEWSIGPYHREYTVPQPVDGTRANASYGNGVLVLALPKLQPGETGRRAEFGLTQYSSGHGEHVGHVGRDLHEESTEEHERRMCDLLCAAVSSDEMSPDESLSKMSGEPPPKNAP